MNELINISNLSKTYFDKNGMTVAVQDFTLSIQQGEFIALIGPSGCGKSTILSILSGLIEKTSGKIQFNGSMKTGYMLQSDQLFNWRTVYKNAILGLEIQNMLNKENIQRVEKMLMEYGLFEFRDHYPNQLSGGMKQRAALIRTLATSPDLLLLDEPFSALDYQSRIAVSDDIFRKIRKENKTVIMVSHDISEAISAADRVVVLTQRPAEIKKIYDIHIPTKSDSLIEKRQTIEFMQYFNSIWEDLDIHV
jgi:NitT/TauT family transport system ATP-binding protein